MSKILVVVDMQNDFLTGTLANESAVAIIPNIKREIESGVYDHIIFTRDTHNENYLNTLEGKRLPVVHCVYGTDGYNITEKLFKPALKTKSFLTIIDKPTFGYKDWGEEFEFDENDEITLTGTVGSICVINNAFAIKAAFPETPVKCIADCVADFSDEDKAATLRVMKNSQIEIS